MYTMSKHEYPTRQMWINPSRPQHILKNIWGWAHWVISFTRELMMEGLTSWNFIKQNLAPKWGEIQNPVTKTSKRKKITAACVNFSALVLTMNPFFILNKSKLGETKTETDEDKETDPILCRPCSCHLWLRRS